MLRSKSPTAIGIRRKNESTPKPGVQGPLGETFSKIKTVAAATI